MRVFAASYLDQVAAMVLVDARPADAALPMYPDTYEGLLRLGKLSPSLAVRLLQCEKLDNCGQAF